MPKTSAKDDAIWLGIAASLAVPGVTLLFASEDGLFYVGLVMTAAAVYFGLAVLAIDLPLPSLRSERARVQVAEHLGTHLRQGQRLYDRSVRSADELDQLRLSYQRWLEATRAWLASDVSEADAIAFESVTGYVAAVPGSYNTEHRNIRLRVLWRIEFLRRVEERAP